VTCHMLIIIVVFCEVCKLV